MTLIILFPVGMGVVEDTVTSKPSICVWKSLHVFTDACHLVYFVPADSKAYASDCDDFK